VVNNKLKQKPAATGNSAAATPSKRNASRHRTLCASQSFSSAAGARLTNARAGWQIRGCLPRPGTTNWWAFSRRRQLLRLMPYMATGGTKLLRQNPFHGTRAIARRAAPGRLIPKSKKPLGGMAKGLVTTEILMESTFSRHLRPR